MAAVLATFPVVTDHLAKGAGRLSFGLGNHVRCSHRKRCLYPPVAADAALIRKLAPYRGKKGNLSFTLGKPLPIDLVERVAIALNQEYAHK